MSQKMGKKDANKNTTANAVGQTPKFAPQTSCSTKYYVGGGDLYIIIDTIYVRVHSSFFLRGTSFFTSFLEPGEKLNESALPGTGRTENAIIIRNATIKEFERFCWVFYNEKIDDYSEATIEEWFTILRLAHTWGFSTVKAMALRYIKQKENDIPNIVDRIVKYEQYAPPVDTILPLYVELCTREEYPTDEECDKLGDTRALKIHRVREKLLREGKKAGGKLDSSRAKALVAETLGLVEKPSVPATSTGKGTPSLPASISETSTDKPGGGKAFTPGTWGNAPSSFDYLRNLDDDS